MRAAVYVSEGTVELTTVPDPTPQGDDVVVKVAACGICGSDLRALTVPPEMPCQPQTIMGHEFVGTVVHAPESSRVEMGARVAVLPNIPCRRCAFCRAGKVNLCSNFVHLGAMRDGGAAELCAVPPDMVFTIDDGLDWATAALAEPLACVLNGSRRANWQPGTSTLILGAGPIGLLFLVMARLAGAAPIIVSEPHPGRREWATRMGASIVIDPVSESVRTAVDDATGGLGVEVVVDAVGSLLDSGIGAVRPGGNVLVFGLNQRAAVTVRPADIASREIGIHCVYIANGTFPLALELLTRHPEAFNPLITHQLPLEEFWTGIETMRSGDGVKVLLQPDGAP
jgi:2-desacetyl-2-hydroxyethyl bacteriochlorophyllide A dehydrogenase